MVATINQSYDLEGYFPVNTRGFLWVLTLESYRNWKHPTYGNHFPIRVVDDGLSIRQGLGVNHNFCRGFDAHFPYDEKIMGKTSTLFKPTFQTPKVEVGLQIPGHPLVE